ncbi:MAG: hypothetical protein M5U28_07235 [Sandaracinaceae bacterium]|nr:hypothetical protein [Sandaracinaceae bacterium]
MTALVAIAGGGEVAPDAGASAAREPAGEPPSIEEAWGMELALLGRRANALGALAAEQAGTPEGVASARRAAELARVLSLRDPEGADWVARARAWLTEASRRRAVRGGCEAALDLARLEARDAHDGAAAYRVAFRTSLRFREEACTAQAARMMAALAPWRPPASELAAIEADPYQGDPSAASEAASRPRSPPRRPRAGPPSGRGEGAASLQALVVYGQGDGRRRARRARCCASTGWSPSSTARRRRRAGCRAEPGWSCRACARARAWPARSR